MGDVSFWLGQDFEPEDQYRGLTIPVRQQWARWKQTPPPLVRSPRSAQANRSTPRALAVRGMTFDQLRPYTPGDDARRIDWNVFARQQQPYVRLYEPEGEEALWFVLDASPSMCVAPVDQVLPLAAGFEWVVQFVLGRPDLSLGRSGVMVLTGREVQVFSAARLDRVRWLEQVRRACLGVVEADPTVPAFEPERFYNRVWPAALATLKTRAAGVVWLSDWLDVPGGVEALVRRQLRGIPVWTPDFLAPPLVKSGKGTTIPNPLPLWIPATSVETPNAPATVLTHWPTAIPARQGPFSRSEPRRGPRS